MTTSSKPPLRGSSPPGDAEGLPPRSVQTFRAPARPVENIAAFRRRRLQGRVILVLLLAWFVGVGWIATWQQEQGEQRRQVEVNTLLTTTRGIQIRVQGQILLCDAALYNQLRGLEHNVDLFNAALLASAESGPSPPDLSALILATNTDQEPNLLMFFSFVMLAVLVSPLVLWQHPLRILLLRPFAEGRVSRSLRSFVRRNVTGWGHVITLADRHINESFILNSTIYSFSPRRLIGQVLAIPLLPLVRLPPLVITVRRETHLPRLFAALNNRYNLNYYSIFNIIRKVRATNALWHRVVLFLMSNADLILVDLTVVREGTLWEVERMAAHGLLSKCLFIAEQGQEDGVTAVMAIIGPEVRRVFWYGRRGLMSASEEFEAAVAQFAGQ